MGIEGWHGQENFWQSWRCNSRSLVSDQVVLKVLHKNRCGFSSRCYLFILREAVRWCQWWWGCEHCPAAGWVLICSPKDLVATLVSLVQSRKLHRINLDAHAIHIKKGIKKAILRVSCAILCFPLKKCSSQRAEMSKLVWLPRYNRRMSLSFRCRCPQRSAWLLASAGGWLSCRGAPKEAESSRVPQAPSYPSVMANRNSSVTHFRKLICCALSFSFLFYSMSVFFLILAFFICISFSWRRRKLS